jgi:superfamily II RNA helicase
MTEVSRLVDRVPLGRHAADDEMLESFIDWVTDLGLELYPAQEEALLEIMAGRHVILNTPTGSGKSLVAIAAEFRAMCTGKRCFYTSPIKALVSEKFFDLCETFGAENVGMQTGDASINADAPVICCTAEVLANLALREGAQAPVDSVVMDEFHYYADRERGIAWQVPLLTLPQATFLLMSATLGDMRRFERDLQARTGREVAIVSSARRPVPLEYEYRETPITETIEELVEKDRAPIYVVNFTQRAAAEQAQGLTSMRLLSRERRQELTQFVGDFRFDSAYGRDIQRFLKAGVGLHHAGLLPKYRRLVEKLAQRGMLAVICGTDTLGVGVNVPIRTVLFSKLCKYDGEKTAILSVRDFKQIAGRAGRKGYDDRGWVVCQAPEHVIENKRLEAKASGAGKKKKFVRRKPPERGYVPWDESTFRRLVDGDPEELRSSFRVTHQMMIELLQRPPTGPAGAKGGGYRALVDLIHESHESDARSSHLRREAAQLFRALRRAEIVELEPAPGGGRRVKINADLQREFSLFQTLALYLVDALDSLEPTADTYALDVVTLVESVLENPRQILLRQQDHARTEAIERMKAEGMEYAQRMEELDRVTYPKPNADFIYRTFDAFCVHHPWVGHENIRPKSILRDMVERYATFNDYVRELGIQRAEGVLLRYLDQAYKTLVQTVPEAYKDDAVVDVIAYLRAMLARVDDSLIREWERMVAGAPIESVAGEEGVAVEVEVDISRDRRGFVARIRAELHRLVQALANRDWEEAAACVRQTEEHAWPTEAFESALEAFFEDHEAIVFDGRARMADNTYLSEREDHLWEVRQVLRDSDDENLWMVVGEVDLRDDRAPSGPLVQVLRIST